MQRVILHSDMNNFYASVECLHNPDLRGRPVAVCGDAEMRHGIVLAKNYEAKKYGIKTGDVIWEAKQKCPGLITVKANFPMYLRFSQIARSIYENFTDKIESFGIDECWLDVTGSVKQYGGGKEIADSIREAIKYQLGCTASVGVSWNKIFAKLGSDMKKPDATTVISEDNYKDKIFKLPAQDLLYVGHATAKKLGNVNINTIGDIANTDVNFLKDLLGKWGEYLWTFASGHDCSPVNPIRHDGIVKSVGNSTTTVRDLSTEQDVRMIVTVMAESVAARLREQWLKGQVISLYLQDKNMTGWGKQIKINEPTFLSTVIIDTAMGLFKKYYAFNAPIRNVGVRVSDLLSADTPRQIDLFVSEKKHINAENMEITMDNIRRRFGHNALRRGLMYLDTSLTGLNPKEDNVIHPYGYF